jgi:hypothetical protein
MQQLGGEWNDYTRGIATTVAGGTASDILGIRYKQPWNTVPHKVLWLYSGTQGSPALN